MIMSILEKVKRTIYTTSSLLTDGKTITNPKDMAENFNNFFTSFGTKLQNNIPLPEGTTLIIQNIQTLKLFLYHPQLPIKLRT